MTEFHGKLNRHSGSAWKETISCYWIYMVPRHICTRYMFCMIFRIQCLMQWVDFWYLVSLVVCCEMNGIWRTEFRSSISGISFMKCVELKQHCTLSRQLFVIFTMRLTLFCSFSCLEYDLLPVGRYILQHVRRSDKYEWASFKQYRRLLTDLIKTRQCWFWIIKEDL